MDSRIIYICSNYDECRQDFKSKRIWRTDGKYEPFVYIIQEIETEMVYIGSRTKFSGRPCRESDLGSIYFTSSKKFDWESNPSSFEVCKIIPCASNHDALILEEILITQNDAVYDDSYYNKHHPNIGFNPSGTTVSEETRIKMSESRSGENHQYFGIPKSNEHREKISNTLKGRILPKEVRDKIGKSISGDKHPMFGKTHSEEAKRKIREARAKQVFPENHSETMSRVTSGENNGMYGKNHTEESKKKMRESIQKREKIECPHCNRSFWKCHYVRSHGDKCKMKGN